MLPSQRSLPLPYHLFDLAGRQLESIGLQWGDFRLETLIQDARRSTGLEDFGDPYYLTGLAQLLASLEKDAHLRFYGRLVMRFMLTNYLCQRLMLVEACRKSPELLKPLTRPPIVVTGLHRSGTTFLHRLLAQDPALASLPFWHLYRPFQLPGRLDLRQWKARVELSILKPIFPGLQAKHRLRACVPEESAWMLGLTFHSMVFWILAPVSSYLQWLWEQDLNPAYQDYARLLAAYQAGYPSQRLVLKAPDHMPHLDLLLHALPGAHIVQLHRDPADCVISLSSLFYSTHIALSDNVQPRHLARANQEMMAYFLQANRKARQNQAVNRSVLDLSFEALIDDPFGAIQRIYENFGLEFTDEYAARLSKSLRERSTRNPHPHHYSAGQFGCSEDELRAFFQGLDSVK